MILNPQRDCHGVTITRVAADLQRRRSNGRNIAAAAVGVNIHIYFNGVDTHFQTRTLGAASPANSPLQTAARSPTTVTSMMGGIVNHSTHRQARRLARRDRAIKSP